MSTPTPLLDAIDDLRAMVAHLARDAAGERCDLTTDAGPGRCPGIVTAIRFEDGFTDAVCGHHADTARHRGALVVDLAP